MELNEYKEMLENLKTMHVHLEEWTYGQLRSRGDPSEYGDMTVACVSINNAIEAIEATITMHEDSQENPIVERNGEWAFSTNWEEFDGYDTADEALAGARRIAKKFGLKRVPAIYFKEQED